MATFLNYATDVGLPSERSASILKSVKGDLATFARHFHPMPMRWNQQQTAATSGGPHVVFGRRVALIVGSAGLILALASDATAQGTEYVYLIDTSGSMVGRPPGSGNANIFPAVKEELIRHFQSLEPGDRVHIRTFDEGIRSAEVFEIGSDADRNRAEQHVRGLQARGQSTWVYQSILNTARERGDESGVSPENAAIYFVYTDGLDNDPQGTNMRGMLEQFSEIKQENDFLIYVTMGVDLPEDDKKVLDDDAYARHVPVPGGEPPRIHLIEIRPHRLDFGFVEDDLSASRQLALHFSSADTSNVTLRFHSSFPEVEALGGVVVVEPTTAGLRAYQEVRLRLVNRQSFPDQAFEGSLTVSADWPHVQVVPDIVTATLSTVPLPTAIVAVDSAGLDFGEVAVGATAPEATLHIEFGNSARSDESGFYVEVESSDPGDPPVPSVAWNGLPVADNNQLLTSASRVNELVVSWPETPADPGPLAGHVRLVPERLRLEGATPLASDDGSVAVPYGLQVSPAPLPWWKRLAFALLALAAGCGIAALVWRLRQPTLYGQLVYEAESVRLKGRRPMSIGAGTEYLPNLPGSVELGPGRPVKATATAGTVHIQRQGEGSKTANALPPGSPLESGDTLIFLHGHDRYDVTFSPY